MTSYEQGFLTKCAEHGVDGRSLLEKSAQYDPYGIYIGSYGADPTDHWETYNPVPTSPSTFTRPSLSHPVDPAKSDEAVRNMDQKAIADLYVRAPAMLGTAIAPGLGLAGASAIIGGGETGASLLEGKGAAESAARGVGAGAATYVGGKVLNAAGKHVIAPAYRWAAPRVGRAASAISSRVRSIADAVGNAKERAFARSMFPADVYGGVKTRKVTPEFRSFLENRRAVAKQVQAGERMQTRYHMTPEIAQKLSRDTGIPATEIYKAYRFGPVDDIEKLTAMPGRDWGTVGKKVYLSAPHHIERASRPEKASGIVDFIRNPISAEDRALARDSGAVVDAIRYQLRHLGIEPTPANIMRYGPELNSMMPLEGIKEYRDFVSSNGLSINDIIRKLRADGVDDAIWHGGAIPDSPDMVDKFGRTWWTGNTAVGFDYAVKPMANASNRGIGATRQALSVIPVPKEGPFRDQVYERFTPHVVDSMDPEKMKIARRILAGEYPDTWWLTRTEATRAPNYETILDPDTLKDQLQNIRRYGVFTEERLGIPQEKIPALHGVDELPSGLSLESGAPVDSVKFVPVERGGNRASSHVPFLRNTGSTYSATKFVPSF